MRIDGSWFENFFDSESCSPVDGSVHGSMGTKERILSSSAHRVMLLTANRSNTPFAVIATSFLFLTPKT